MKCEDARMEAMDGRPVAHINECDECRSFMNDYGKITGMIRTETPVPAGLQSRLSRLAQPRRVIRLYAAAALAAAIALVIGLPMLFPKKIETPPAANEETALIDAELEAIRADVERSDLKLRTLGLELK